MTISRSHIIDERAEKIFESTIPWLKRKQIPDHGIDYFIEIVQVYEPSGLIFAVQLKGTESPHYTKTHLKQILKTKHIAYYIDKVRQPAFIVTVDVNTKKGYWLFIQKWIRQKFSGCNWRKNRNLTISIPLDNKLDDIDKFYHAVEEAELYMREFWPSSVPAAALHEKAKLEALDNRFCIDVSYQQGKTIYTLLPKQKVSGALIFHSKNREDLTKKISDLIERGISVKFKPEEFQITGSDLFKKISKHYSFNEVVLQACKKRECQFHILALNSQNEEKHILYGIKGNMTGGTKEIRFEGTLPEAPLTFEFSLIFNDIFQTTPGYFNLSFDVDKWSGQPLLQASYFNAIARLFELLDRNEPLKISCEINGNRLFSVIPTINEIQDFTKQVLTLITFFQKARDVARKLHINPIVPHFKQLTEKDFETVNILFAILKEGTFQQEARGLKVSCTLTPNQTFKEILAQNSSTLKGSLKFISEPNIEFLGVNIRDWVLTYQLTKMELTPESKERVGKLVEPFEGSIFLEWEGTEDSELMITLQKHVPDSPGVTIFHSQ